MRKSLYGLWKVKFKQQFEDDEHDGLGDWSNSCLMREVNRFCNQPTLQDYSIPWQQPTTEHPTPPLVTQTTNVPKWWAGCREYWRLKLIARAVLGVPASAISCERIWSSCGRVFTKLRGSLSADTGGKQVVLHELAKAEERFAWLQEHMKK